MKGVDMEKESKEGEVGARLDVCRTTLWTAVGVMVVGCGLLVAAIAIPPPGVIDHSILVAFGEISTFSGALLGVRLKVRKKEP